MIRKLTAKSSLDSLKKEAKRWLKALRAHDPEALARLKQDVPGSDATAGLREVQQGREHGAEIAELLLAHGADPSFTNTKGLTAADEAEQRGMDMLAQVLRDARQT